MNEVKRTLRGRPLDGSPNKVDVYVGSRIRLRRIMLNISQIELATRLGVTFQQIQKYEKGANRIGCSRLWDICQEMGIDMNYFFKDMPQDVADNSPRRLALTGNKNTEILAEDDPMMRTETLKLVSDFYRIHNRKLREHVLNLVSEMAKSKSYLPQEEGTGTVVD